MNNKNFINDVDKRHDFLEKSNLQNIVHYFNSLEKLTTNNIKINTIIDEDCDYVTDVITQKINDKFNTLNDDSDDIDYTIPGNVTFYEKLRSIIDNMYNNIYSKNDMNYILTLITCLNDELNTSQLNIFIKLYPELMLVITSNQNVVNYCYSNITHNIKKDILDMDYIKKLKDITEKFNNKTIDKKKFKSYKKILNQKLFENNGYTAYYYTKFLNKIITSRDYYKSINITD